jgi:hypothetical protein
LLPSQSPQPEAQLGAQPFEVHSFSPWSFLQDSPQLRQLSFVLSATSQPSVGTPLQSLWPESHSSSSHTLFTHLPDALGNAHVWPQSPQFCASFERLVRHLPAPGQVSSGAVQLDTPHSDSSQQNHSRHARCRSRRSLLAVVSVSQRQRRRSQSARPDVA